MYRRRPSATRTAEGSGRGWSLRQIFHNPNCGTSRNVLAALTEAGAKPKVVEYLKAGWTARQLKGLLAAMKARPRDILRVLALPPKKGSGLTRPAATDTAILAAMVAHPILVERPIVVTPKGTALCRPASGCGLCCSRGRSCRARGARRNQGTRAYNSSNPA